MEQPQEKPTGPICQSCGMPMEKAEDFGTNADGSQNEEFCINCFQNGSFTEPDITMKQMIEKVAGFLEGLGLSKEDAKKAAEGTIPKLGRWKTDPTEYI